MNELLTIDYYLFLGTVHYGQNELYKLKIRLTRLLEPERVLNSYHN